jgi:hypothetical protein
MFLGKKYEMGLYRVGEMWLYTNTQGRKFETVLWLILVHVINHGT